MQCAISTGDASAAVGSYRQAATNGGLVERSGAQQTEQCLDNVEAILESEGLSLSDVLKVGVFLDDIEDFEEMNGIYPEYLDEEPPARSALEVGCVPMGATLEIEAVAASE